MPVIWLGSVWARKFQTPGRYTRFSCAKPWVIRQIVLEIRTKQQTALGKHLNPIQFACKRVLITRTTRTIRRNPVQTFASAVQAAQMPVQGIQIGKPDRIATFGPRLIRPANGPEPRKNGTQNQNTQGDEGRAHISRVAESYAPKGAQQAKQLPRAGLWKRRTASAHH